MNNGEMRNLEDGTLEKVLQRTNEDFLKALPADPKYIFQFAKRRREPKISENISYNLGIKMLDSRLSDEEYFETFLKIIADSFYNKKKSLIEKKIANILIAQTGAGKTNLAKLVLENNKNSIIINSDQYKGFRPDAKKLMEEDPTNFGALTGIDSYDHAQNLFQLVTQLQYPVLMESAPSFLEGIIGIDFQRLEEKKYDTNFHFLAVGNLVSSLGIHYRYEKAMTKPDENVGAKLTDKKRHDESYEAVEQIIQSLISDKIKIYRRGDETNNRVPVLLNHNANGVVENLSLLNNERYRSNVEYANNNFVSDYETIKKLMEQRNAPQKQFEQLEEIFQDYLVFQRKIEAR